MFAASKTASVSGGYQISRSLRFNSADSAYLNRTPASAGNRRTYTFSTWVKRSQLNSGNAMLAAINGSAFNYFSFGTSTGDFLTFAYFDGATDIFGVNTSNTSVFRDVSAWYHIILAVDTTQATASNRVKFYVNSVEQTGLGGTYPTQNYDTPINNSISNLIGGVTGSYTAYMADQYMTEVNFIDGQALTPSSFGETNAQTGVWQPKAYSGSYGTNGFYLNFSDNSNTTAATLGKDYSGNGNNWTPNNFSVTAGAGNDSLVDSPTSYGTDTGVGGTVRGNYATLNPLKKKSAATISNGNLALVATSAVYVTGLSTISPSSGTYYMEMVCSGSNSNRPWAIGMVETTASADASMSSTGTYFVTNNSGSTVNYYVAGSPTALSTSSTWVAGDIISLAWNVDSGKFWVGLNGVWYPSSTGGTVASNSDVAAGNYPTFTISYSGNTNPQVIPAFVTYDTTASIDANFGQRPFAYTAPSGFKALCTQNLPTPTIGATTATQAGKFFNPVLYTGTGSDNRAVTGVGFQPDFVWVKGRDIGQSHVLNNAVAGVGTAKTLYSNLSVSQGTYDDYGYLQSLDADGYTIKNGSINGNLVNASGYQYVAWNWKANGSGSTNTAGSITSTVSANTTSGFSVVTLTYSGAGTVGHGLGVAPQMIIVKRRDSTGNWFIAHTGLTNMSGYYILLDSTGGQGAANWGGSPTSTTFNMSNNLFSSGTYIAYCFAPIAGYSAFGSYTGNGSADGPFVFTGFRPAFVIIKRSDTTSANWSMFDSTRNINNVVDKELDPNTSGAEQTFTTLDFTSNGIKIRNTDSQFNQSGVPYIYACFAQNPFKYSLAR